LALSLSTRSSKRSGEAVGGLDGCVMIVREGATGAAVWLLCHHADP
jgi:hypothetical protein